MDNVNSIIEQVISKLSECCLWKSIYLHLVARIFLNYNCLQVCEDILIINDSFIHSV